MNKTEWTKEQKEVWKREEEYWDFYSSGNLDAFMKLWHRDFKGWPSFASKPASKKKLKKSMKETIESLANINIKYKLTPHEINCCDKNVYATLYLYTTKFKNEEGKTVKSSGRITHTWKKTNGTWKIISGMSAPAE